MANATNRVGVVVQNIVGVTTFQRSGKLNLSNSTWLVAAALPGGVLGAWAASRLGKAQMDLIIGAVMVVMFFVIWFEPEKWLRKHSAVAEGRPKWWILALFAAIGFYGGFIQAGVGVFILAAMVLGMNYSLPHANAIKLMIVLVVTAAAILVFSLNSDEQLIRWGPGLLMAVGQSIGAWAAARFSTSYKDANLWTRRLLMAVVIISILEFFGILDRVFALFA